MSMGSSPHFYAFAKLSRVTTNEHFRIMSEFCEQVVRRKVFHLVTFESKPQYRHCIIKGFDSQCNFNQSF